MIIQKLASELGLSSVQIVNTIQLFDGGNTVPFIARYRKEMTGGMDEEQLRQLSERLTYRRNLEDRKTTIIKTIKEQGKLSPELATAIQQADTLRQVEDLYLPYKPKRRTRATTARERGLEPLSKLILEQPLKMKSLDQTAKSYLSDQVPTATDAWAGARDIVAEIVSDDADVRERVRSVIKRDASIHVQLADETADPKGVYRLYYNFGMHHQYLKPHQVLAINRGEQEKVLKFELQEPIDKAVAGVRFFYPAQRNSPLSEQILLATEDAYHRLIRPAIERELRRDLTEAASQHAIHVFSTNLRNLLLAPPLRGHTILALDPGFRTGCKVALVSPTGSVLDTGTIYPHPPQKKWEQSKRSLIEWIERFDVTLLAIGNGTASRETEKLATEVIENTKDVRYVVVSEAGASVYSAMPLARQELPGMDVSLRGAVSIGRRTIDPLAELVKIDPKSIGVGMYQHDVDQKKLAGALDTVVESAVNHVGVNLNTASPALLQFVSGLGSKNATAIVYHRDENGPFRSRKQLLSVKGIGPKAFEQAAGFLRIQNGDQPLDNTAVHPESYPVVERLITVMQNAKSFKKETVDWRTLPRLVPQLRKHIDNLSGLASSLKVGEMTLADILDELEKPGRDPRDDLPAPILRSDVLSMDDLKPGMKLKGTVRNVVDFGAFIDIGVKQDGLVHISQMSDRHVRDPYAIVSVGDVVNVTVLDIDPDRGRISLSLRV